MKNYTTFSNIINSNVESFSDNSPKDVMVYGAEDKMDAKQGNLSV